ncbi:MAG: PTS sugar transporter subunit IIA [Alkalispirochaetaceae bacterium]
MLLEMLDERCIDLSYPKRKRKQVVRRLLELAELTGAVREPEELTKQILQRDNEVSTAVGNGVAIPHLLSPRVDRQLLVFLRTEKPAAFSPPDGFPVRLLFLLLAPEGAVNEHLRTLSRLARLLHDTSFRNALLEVEKPEEVVELLREREK